MKLLTSILALTTIAQQPAVADVEVERLTITVNAEQADGVRLWHATDAPVPGNAAQDYLRAAMFAHDSDAEPDSPESIVGEYQATPAFEIDPARAAYATSQTVGAFKDYLRTASRRTNCDWGLAPATYETLLPELNYLRVMANRLSLESKLAINASVKAVGLGDEAGQRVLTVEGLEGASAAVLDLSEASVVELVAENVRLMGATADDLQRQGFLVSLLVAEGIERQALATLRDYVQRPTATNLTSALDSLRVSQADLASAAAMERAGIYSTFPELLQALEGDLTPSAAAAFAKEFRRYLEMLDALPTDMGAPGMSPELVIEWTRGYERVFNEQMAALDLPPAEAIEALQRIDLQQAAPLSSLMPSLDRALLQLHTAERELALLRAVERLRGMNNLPETFDAGSDPVSGKPIVYARTEAGFTLETASLSAKSGRRYEVTVRE